jgi:hypothetical protein
MRVIHAGCYYCGLNLEKDENIEYFFLHVDEAYDDIEERGCFWDNQLGMGIVRKIVFDTEADNLKHQEQGAIGGMCAEPPR